MPDNFGSSKPAPPPKGGPLDKSEEQSAQPQPGYGLSPESYATPELKRSGYGYQAVPGGVGSSMGGHNQTKDNQYTAKLPRGSSM
jgi:hypothetical protein